MFYWWQIKLKINPVPIRIRDEEEIKNRIKIRIVFINFVMKYVGLQEPMKADQEIPEFLERTQFVYHCSMRCSDLPCHLLHIILERVFCHLTFIYAKTIYQKYQTEPCSIFSFVLSVCVCVCVCLCVCVCVCVDTDTVLCISK